VSKAIVSSRPAPEITATGIAVLSAVGRPTVAWEGCACRPGGSSPVACRPGVGRAVWPRIARGRRRSRACFVACHAGRLKGEKPVFRGCQRSREVRASPRAWYDRTALLRLLDADSERRQKRRSTHLVPPANWGFRHFDPEVFHALAEARVGWSPRHLGGVQKQPLAGRHLLRRSSARC
jgi:hypothetical protein